MKKIKITIVIFFITITSLMAQNKADAIIGVWESDSKDAKIEIFKNGEIYYAKLLWGDKIVEADRKTSKKDLKNPDVKLRSRNIIGIVNVSGLKYEGQKYINGNIYDPTSGKVFKCSAWMEEDNLHLRGYIGFSLLGQTIIWHRHKE